MKALSLLQPWATLVMLGDDVKQYETRSWATTHLHERLAIHASLGKPAVARAAYKDPLIADVLAAHGLTFDTLPRGAVLGTVEVRAMHRITADFVAGLSPMELAAGIYTLDAGRWAWQLENCEPLVAPVPCPGALKLWNVPKEIEYEFFFN